MVSYSYELSISSSQGWINLINLDIDISHILLNIRSSSNVFLMRELFKSSTASPTFIYNNNSLTMSVDGEENTRSTLRPPVHTTLLKRARSGGLTFQRSKAYFFVIQRVYSEDALMNPFIMNLRGWR
jgi:hypothetical protein